MTPEQRQQAIRGMVEGLAAQNEGEPGRSRRLAAPRQRLEGFGRERQRRRRLRQGRCAGSGRCPPAGRLGRGPCPPARARRAALARGGRRDAAPGEGRAPKRPGAVLSRRRLASPPATSRPPPSAGRRCWRCCRPTRRSARCCSSASRKRKARRPRRPLLRQPGQHQMVAEQPALVGILEGMPLGEAPGAEARDGRAAASAPTSRASSIWPLAARLAARKRRLADEARIERRRLARPLHRVVIVAGGVARQRHQSRSCRTRARRRARGGARYRRAACASRVSPM